jgi:hypothetical protein
MSYLSTNLKDKHLRIRIDGINFTSIKACPELKHLEKQDVLAFKHSVLRDAVNQLKSVLKFDPSFVDISKTKLTINLASSLGIFIEGYFREHDFFILIQFKGFFFIDDDAFNKCRAVVFKLTEVFNNLFRLTLVDVAQDFMVPVDALLPNPLEESDEFKYCFRFKTRHHSENTVNGFKYTGFTLESSRWKMTLYDKLEEIRKAKNLEKKEYYENIYAEFKDGSVTRIELRIKQEYCRSLTKSFYTITNEEPRFIKECLLQIYNKHKLRIPKFNSHDQDYRRWPIHPNWKFIFGEDFSPTPKKLSSPDYKYTSGRQDVDKSLYTLIDTIIGSDPNISREQLCERLACLNIDEILRKAKLGHQKRTETLENLETIKNQALARYRNSDWLDPS